MRSPAHLGRPTPRCHPSSRLTTGRPLLTAHPLSLFLFWRITPPIRKPTHQTTTTPALTSTPLPSPQPPLAPSRVPGPYPSAPGPPLAYLARPRRPSLPARPRSLPAGGRALAAHPTPHALIAQCNDCIMQSHHSAITPSSTPPPPLGVGTSGPGPPEPPPGKPKPSPPPAASGPPLAAPTRPLLSRRPASPALRPCSCTPFSSCPRSPANLAPPEHQPPCISPTPALARSPVYPAGKPPNPLASLFSCYPPGCRHLRSPPHLGRPPPPRPGARHPFLAYPSGKPKTRRTPPTSRLPNKSENQLPNKPKSRQVGKLASWQVGKRPRTVPAHPTHRSPPPCNICSRSRFLLPRGKQTPPAVSRLNPPHQLASARAPAPTAATSSPPLRSPSYPRVN